MTDDVIAGEALFRDFEADVLSGKGFGHREHVQVAWYHLKHYPLIVALARFSAGIQALAARAGAPQKYHATITSAFMLLVRERMGEPAEAWSAFAARSPELFQWPSPLLASHYRDDTLASARAREAFVLPDRDRSTEVLAQALKTRARPGEARPAKLVRRSSSGEARPAKLVRRSSSRLSSSGEARPAKLVRRSSSGYG